MPYSKLLNKIIAESDYTAKDIVAECNNMGLKIDKTYLSKIRNNKLPPPAEEVSRAIAKVCNVDERLLVLEGYIDKAPKEIKEVFDQIKIESINAGLGLFDNVFDIKTLKAIEEEIHKEPITDFIIELLDSKNVNLQEFTEQLEITRDTKNNFNLLQNQPFNIKIKDNGMFPIVPENAGIILEMQKENKNGDIVAIKIKDKEEIIARTVVFESNNKVLLIPLNKKFDNEIYNKNDITILGKIKRIITEIQ